MKRVISYSIIFILCYLAMSFINISLDCTLWVQEDRVGIIAALICIIFIKEIWIFMKPLDD